MSVEIRPFRPGDEVGMSVMHRRSIVELCGKDYTAEQVEGWSANIDAVNYLRSMQTFNETYWVVEQAGTITAFGAWYGERISSFFVHPLHARQGLGRLLFTALEQDYWQQSGRNICLIEATLTATPFYERMGFTVLEPGLRRFRNGTEIAVRHLRKEKPIA